MRLLGLFAATGVFALMADAASANPPQVPVSPPRILNTAPSAQVPAPGSLETAVPSANDTSSEPAAAMPKSADKPDAAKSDVGKDDKAAAKPAVTPVAQPKSPSLEARIDLTRQEMTVSVHGKTLYNWRISSGRAGYETPTGSFRPNRTEEMWYSTQYDDAPMPHSVFFNGGIATHGTNATRGLGSPASHGCVRLAPSNAKRFYNLVHKYGLRRTRIVVTGKTPVSSSVARRRSRDRYVERDYDDVRPRDERRARRRLYVDRYGYAPPQPYYYPPPRMVYPGDGPRYRYGW